MTITYGRCISYGSTWFVVVKNSISLSSVVMSSRDGFRCSWDVLCSVDADISSVSSDVAGVWAWCRGVDSRICFVDCSRGDTLEYSVGVTCSLAPHSVLSSRCAGHACSLSFGGRCSGLWFADTYSVGSVVTGVEAEPEGTVAMSWCMGLSYGADPISWSFSAGVITISSTVVRRVVG